MTGKTNSVVYPAAHIEFTATVGDNTLHLRTQTAGFDCTIYWGDGQLTVAPVDGGNIIHNYAQAGVYHIFFVGKSFAGFYVNNQTGKEKYTALHSMGRWVNDTLTSMSSSFWGCSGLTAVSTGALQYNTEVSTFASCFRSTGLTTLPPNLFQHNMAATGFATCLYACTGLTLRNDIFGVDYANRFLGKSMNFTNCFNRTSFTGTQGTAPQLWSFTYGSVASTNCFAGAGNSAESLSNYADIPAGWK